MSDTLIEVEKHINYLIEHVVCPQITSNAVGKMRVALLFNSKEVHNEVHIKDLHLKLWKDASVIPPLMRLWQEGDEFKASPGTQKDVLHIEKFLQKSYK